jgi:hypothetical protein
MQARLLPLLLCTLHDLNFMSFLVPVLVIACPVCGTPRLSSLAALDLQPGHSLAYSFALPHPSACRKPQAPYPSAVIEELDSDISSDGTADAVIERDMRYYAGSSSSSSITGLPLDMQDLCTLAGRLVSGVLFLPAGPCCSCWLCA